MKSIAIIPARMQASRFPGKPLHLISGVPLVEHVRQRVAMCEELDDVIVATCDEEIKRAVEKYGGKAVMTSDKHTRCTDRIAEAAKQFNADVVVNVQGDEPLILPSMITAVLKPLKEDNSLVCTNMIAAISGDEEFNNQNVPKVVCNLKGDILYISREPIPSKRMAKIKDYPRYNQLGLIAFRSQFLQLFSQLGETLLEKIESVDMMRAIENGFTVRSVVTQRHMIGVDVIEDVAKVEKVLEDDELFQKYRKLYNIEVNR